MIAFAPVLPPRAYRAGRVRVYCAAPIGAETPRGGPIMPAHYHPSHHHPRRRTARRSRAACRRTRGTGHRGRGHAGPARQCDRSRGNWLMNHRTYDAQRYSPLDQINKANVKGLKLAYAVAIGGTSANENLQVDAARRGRLPLRRRPMGRGLQDRRPLGRDRPHRVAHGPGPGEDRRWPIAAPRCGAISSSPSPTIPPRVIATNKETGKVAWETNLVRRPGRPAASPRRRWP